MVFELYEIHITKEIRFACFGPYLEESCIIERNKDPKILLKLFKDACNTFIDEVIADYGITISSYSDDMLCITAQNKIYEEDDKDYIEKHLTVNFYGKAPYYI